MRRILFGRSKASLIASFCIFLTLVLIGTTATKTFKERSSHNIGRNADPTAIIKGLSNTLVKKFPLDDLLDPYTGTLLAPILIPRTPGSDGSHDVRQHFLDTFDSLNRELVAIDEETSSDETSKTGNTTKWTVIHDAFTAEAPVATDPTQKQDIEFENLVFRRDPLIDDDDEEEEVKRLTLVAHFDSKVLPEGFIGAIDSAFPCALLLYVAFVINKLIDEAWASQNASQRLGVQMIFLDGEEAFYQWTSEDSLYGSRHLAEVWKDSSDLKTIDSFLLFDLLGSANATVPSFFKSGHKDYLALAEINRLLLEAQETKRQLILSSVVPNDGKSGIITDDHVPFLEAGVKNIVHLIAAPFPSCWHEMCDDASFLDMDAISDWANIASIYTLARVFGDFIDPLSFLLNL